MAGVALAGGISDPYEWFLTGANPSDPGSVGGRITAVLLYVLFSIGFTGLFIMYIINWMDRRKDRWESGVSRYNIRDNFALVIGGHDMTPRICARLLSDPSNRYVIVTTDGNAAELRHKIYSELQPGMRSRLIVYRASQTSDIELKMLNAHRANAVYVFGENDNVSHDADNVDTYRRLLSIDSGGAKLASVPCHVMLYGVSAGRVFHVSDVESRDRSPFDFRPFFYYDEWARRVVAGDGSAYPGVATPAVLAPEAEGRVHIIVLGLTDMSLAVVRQAAQLVHLPNHVSRQDHPVTRITIVDSNILYWLECRRNSHRQLFGAMDWQQKDSITWYAQAVPGLTDVEWVMIEADPDTLVAQQAVSKYIAEGRDDAVTVVVSHPAGDNESVSTAFNLSPDIYAADTVHQVLVAQIGSPSMIEAVAKGVRWTDKDGNSQYSPSGFAKYLPFGMRSQCDYVSYFEAVGAKTMAYAYSHIQSDSEMKRLLESARRGDFSALDETWQSLSTCGGKSVMSQRMSNVYSVASIPFKAGWMLHTDSVELTQPMVEVLAEVEHYRWNMEQLLGGYRPMTEAEAADLRAGRVSRADLKSRYIHPDLVPYACLSEESRNYDRAIVRSIPNVLQICRLYNEQ